MNDDESLTGIFSHAEQHIGTDAYQAGVEQTKAQTRVTNRIAEVMEAKAMALRFLCLVVLLVALPCMVWLWRWAL